MLHSIFILRENGVCVYERHWVETDIDAHLFSGFITALSAFAVESMGETLQQLKLVKDRRLAILKHHKAPIIGVVIADARDSGALLNKLLNRILEKFYWIFREEIRSEDASLLGKTRERFSKQIDILLKGKIAERSFMSLLIGYLVGSGISIGITALIFIFGREFAYSGGLQNVFAAPIFIFLYDGMQPWEFLDIQQIAVIAMGIVSLFFIMIFFFPSIISAYIAGNRNLGVLNGLLLLIGGFFTVLVLQNIPLFAGYSINTIPLFVGFSPLIVPYIILTGYFGGVLRERTRLYPIRGEELSEKVMKQVTIIVKKTLESLDLSEKNK